MPMDRLPDVEAIVHVHDDPIPLVRLDKRTREVVVHGVYLAGVPVRSCRGGGDVESVFPSGLPLANTTAGDMALTGFARGFHLLDRTQALGLRVAVTLGRGGCE